jgi:UDP-glucuronate 4-epimerase
MRFLVTGAAGFIGSHLSERLLADGHEVVGLDSLIPTYDTRQRLASLAVLDRAEGFTLRIDDLRYVDLAELLDGVDLVYHLAAIPGVRASWSQFASYLEHNVLALQRLLDGIRDSRVQRLVWASSSSVYGETDRYPTREEDATHPHSPYGATKLAGEHLVGAYVRNHGLDVLGLRYFSVYGPRQRPDMGVHRLFEAALGFGEFELYGDGTQVRDMTFVSDVVDATVAGSKADVPSGSNLNVAGGCMVSLNEVIEQIESLVGRAIPMERSNVQVGDVRQTAGDTTRARESLGWEPSVGLEAGLRQQLEWHRRRREHRWPETLA